MTEENSPEQSEQEFTRWQIVKSGTILVLLVTVAIFGIWTLFFTNDSKKVFVIQKVNDDCFRRLLVTSEGGPDEWKMKVCISKNNGYVDENGKIIHP